jgi:hypothetical protein
MNGHAGEADAALPPGVQGRVGRGPAGRGVMPISVAVSRRESETVVASPVWEAKPGPKADALPGTATAAAPMNPRTMSGLTSARIGLSRLLGSAVGPPAFLD